MCRMCGRHRENSTHVGECDVIRKIFKRIYKKLGCLQERFTYPTSAEGRHWQAKRILIACPGEGAPKSIINFMIIYYGRIYVPISFYKVDIENAPFKPDVVWYYTLKRFADLALGTSARGPHPTYSCELSAGAKDPLSLTVGSRLGPGKKQTFWERSDMAPGGEDRLVSGPVSSDNGDAGRSRKGRNESARSGRWAASATATARATCVSGYET
jgi:hypothetical protein